MHKFTHDEAAAEMKADPIDVVWLGADASSPHECDHRHRWLNVVTGELLLAAEEQRPDGALTEDAAKVAKDIENACLWIHAFAYVASTNDDAVGDRAHLAAHDARAKACDAYSDTCDAFPMWLCSKLFHKLDSAIGRGSVDGWRARQACEAAELAALRAGRAARA